MKTLLLILVSAITVSAQNVYPSRINNLALLPGTTVSASSTAPGFAAEAAIDGDRLGNLCQIVGNVAPCGGGHDGWWNDNTYTVFPDSLTVTLPRAYALSRIVIVTFQDDFNGLHVEPYLGLRVGGNYTIEDFTIEVRKPDGTWVEVAEQEENLDIVREYCFTPILATAYRVTVSDSYADYSRVVEFEAYAH